MKNYDLIDYLELNNYIYSSEIKKALLKADRSLFMPQDLISYAYQDSAMPIGFGQTISQPSTVTRMLELLEVKKNQKILDVGSGSGWTTAILSFMVGNNGKIYGMERVPELVFFGQSNINKLNIKNAKISQATKDIGLKKHGPYDRILVSAKTDIIPIELINQLKIGGIMVIPIIDSLYKILKEKSGYKITEKIPGFSFVDLIV